MFFSISRLNLYSISIIALISFTVYGNALSNGFVWDDNAIILENKSIRSLDISQLKDFFTSSEVYNTVRGDVYRPLYILSYAIEYNFFGLDPFWYHLNNVIIHAINSVIVFLTASLLLNNRSPRLAGFNQAERGHDSRFTVYLSPAFISALLFAVHPVHTEAVTWIKDRDDLIVLFFMMIAFCLYMKTEERNHRSEEEVDNPRSTIYDLRFTVHYFLSLFFYVCALLSKEMAITLPLILLLYDLTIHHSPFTTQRLIRYLPFWLITFLYLGVRTFILGQVGQDNTYLAGNLVSTLYTMARGMVHYLKILILPINLSADHLTFPLSRGMDMEVFLSISVLLLIFIGSIVLYKYSRIAAFSILWFFITILPVSNIIPLRITIAERFLYIPSFGFCLLLGLVLNSVGERGLAFWRGLRPIAVFTLIIVVLLYSYGTILRNKVWKDGYTLWSDVIERYPDNQRAHVNLGNAYEKRELYREAAVEYLRAIEIDPRDAYAHYNLGTLYAKTSNTEDAVKEYTKTLLIDPEFSGAHYNLGVLYEEMGLYSKAINELKEVLRMESKATDAHLSLGKIYIKTGDYAAAITEFLSVLESDPKNQEALALLRESQRKLKDQ